MGGKQALAAFRSRQHTSAGSISEKTHGPRYLPTNHARATPRFFASHFLLTSAAGVAVVAAPAARATLCHDWHVFHLPWVVLGPGKVVPVDTRNVSTMVTYYGCTTSR